MSATNPTESPRSAQPRWYAPTPAKFLFAVLVMQGVLFLSAHYRWFWFNERKGYTVLITVAATAVALLLFGATVFLSQFFTAKAQFGVATLLLMVPVMGIPCAWLAREMELARQQGEAIAAIKEMEGSVDYHLYSAMISGRNWGPFPPDWLVSKVGRDFCEHVLGAHLLRPTHVDLHWLERFTHLRELTLEDVAAGDADLQHLRGLTALEELRLDSNQITNVGIAHLSKLAQLRGLDLSHALVTSSGLQSLQGLARLERLTLNDTKVDDDGLEHLKGLEQLRLLELNGTQVTGPGLRHLSGLPSLVHLDLSGTPITDAGLANIKVLPQLHRLYLHDAQVTDAGLVHLRGLEELGLLGLDYVHITDRSVEHLRDLTKLQRLVVSKPEGQVDSVEFTRALATLQSYLPECVIDVYENESPDG